MPINPPASDSSPLIHSQTSRRPRLSWPVPSRGALRILYQLAYISSGTAVGLGLLCAEERRRRIQLVQRVVDNGNRIRNSPRYNHGASSRLLARLEAKLAEAENGAGASDRRDEVGGGGKELLDSPKGNGRAKQFGALTRDEGAKSPELPSVVDQEYGGLYEFARPRKKRHRSLRPIIDNEARQPQRRSFHSTAGKLHEGGANDDGTLLSSGQSKETYGSANNYSLLDVEENDSLVEQPSAGSSISNSPPKPSSDFDKSRWFPLWTQTAPLPRARDEQHSFQEKVLKNSTWKRQGIKPRHRELVRSHPSRNKVDGDDPRTESRPVGTGLPFGVELPELVGVKESPSHEIKAEDGGQIGSVASDLRPITESLTSSVPRDSARAAMKWHDENIGDDPKNSARLRQSEIKVPAGSGVEDGVKEKQDAISEQESDMTPHASESHLVDRVITSLESARLEDPMSALEVLQPDTSHDTLTSSPDGQDFQPYSFLDQQFVDLMGADDHAKSNVAHSQTSNTDSPDNLELGRAEYLSRTQILDEQQYQSDSSQALPEKSHITEPPQLERMMFRPFGLESDEARGNRPLDSNRTSLDTSEQLDEAETLTRAQSAAEPAPAEDPLNVLVVSSSKSGSETLSGRPQLEKVEKKQGEDHNQLRQQFRPQSQPMFRRLRGLANSNLTKGSILSRAIARDVSTFFKRSRRQGKQAEFELAAIAALLFARACHHGSLDDIHALIEWKNKADQISKKEFLKLCRLAGSFASRFDHPQLFEFYKSLFEMDAVQRLCAESPREYLYQVFGVLGDVMTWRSDLDASSRAVGLLRGIFERTPARVALEALEQKCRFEWKWSRLSKAVDLFVAVLGCRSPTTDFEAPLVDIALADGPAESLYTLWEDFIGATMDEGDIDRCAKLLSLRPPLAGDAKHVPSIHKLFSTFIKACHTREAYQTLARTCFEVAGKDVHNLTWLSEEDRVVLALACSFDPTKQEQFKIIYLSLESRETRRELAEQAMCSALLANSKTTRNFPLIHATYSQYRSLAVQDGFDELIRQLDIACLECSIYAGQSEQWIDKLPQIYDTEKTSRQTIALHAMILAKRQSWDAVTRLLSLALSLSLDDDMEESRRILHKVLNLYAKDNSAVATWDFALVLIKDYGVAPSRMTHKLLLHAFTADGRLDLIPQWLEYTKSIDMPFSLDSYTAAELMTSNFRQRRFPSAVLIRQCRDVFSFCSGFDPAPFYNLIKEALAFETRRMRGPLGEVLQQNSRTRQEWYAFIEHTGLIPGPGDAVEESILFPSNLSLLRDGNKLHQSQTTIPPKHDVADNCDYSGLQWGVRCTTSKDFVSDILALPEPSNLPESATMDTVTTEHRHLSDQQCDSRNDSAVDLPHPSIAPTSSEDHSSPLKASSGEMSDAEMSAYSSGITPETGMPRSAEPTESIESIAGHREDFLSPLRATGMDESHNSDQSADDISNSLADADSEQPQAFHAPLDSEGKSNTPDSIGRVAQRRLRNMISAYSVGDDDQVLTMYRECLEAHGMPFPSRTLSLAVSASLRRSRGDDAEAQSILNEAQRAGMEVSFAMAELLMNRMSKSQLSKRQDYEAMRRIILDYYDTLKRNGHRVDPHVGVHAASTLMRSYRPARGLALLSELFTSHIAIDTKPDIVMMTLFLRGYTWTMSMQGVFWAVKTVLDHNVQINQQFMQQLRRTFKTLSTKSGLSMINRKLRRTSVAFQQPSTEIRETLRKWFRLCEERRRTQKDENMQSGRELVNTIIAVAGNGPEWEETKAYRAGLPPKLKAKPDYRSRQKQGKQMPGIDAVQDDVKHAFNSKDASQQPADQEVSGPLPSADDRSAGNIKPPVPASDELDDDAAQPDEQSQSETDNASGDLAWLEDYRKFLEPQPTFPNRSKARSPSVDESSQ